MPRPDLHDVYVVEPLDKRHNRSGLSCGVVALDKYIREQASQDAHRNVASVFVAVERASGAVHGFYTLSMAGVALDLVPDSLARKMPRYPSVPAVRLGRLAVHVDARGRGLGGHLLMDAMARSLQSEIAWAAFIVDAKDETARGFHMKFGFLALLDDKNHLFLPRRTISALFE